MALIQLTDAGVALMESATAPIVATHYKLGTQSGYVPEMIQTDLKGMLVHAGIPSAPVVEDSNNIKYSVVLSPTVGPFLFGEVGLFVGETLFAMCVFEISEEKLPYNPTDSTGGAYTLDIYLPMVGDNYEMWANVTQANTFKVSVVRGPEALPVSVSAVPNIYVIQGFTTADKSFLAYTDRVGLWNFDGYNTLTEVLISGGGTDVISVAASELPDFVTYTPNQYIIQLISGPQYGACRYVTGITTGDPLFLHLNAPLAKAVTAGERIRVLRQFNADLAVATQNYVGTVQPGHSLTITETGVVDVNESVTLTDLAGNVLGFLVKKD